MGSASELSWPSSFGSVSGRRAHAHDLDCQTLGSGPVVVHLIGKIPDHAAGPSASVWWRSNFAPVPINMVPAKTVMNRHSA